jgi:hypothetical protein
VLEVAIATGGKVAGIWRVMGNLEGDGWATGEIHVKNLREPVGQPLFSISVLW